LPARLCPPHLLGDAKLEVARVAATDADRDTLGPNNVIDGNFETTYKSVKARNPWLSLNLGSETRVGLVKVYNRQDKYAKWLTGFEIWLSNKAGSRNKELKCGGAEFDERAEPRPYVIDCRGQAGSFVTIVHTGTNHWLAIAEIEAYGVAPIVVDSPPPSVASPPVSPPPGLSCDTRPCAAPVEGEVAQTVPDRSSKSWPVHGPFEHGFGSAQDEFLLGLGCRSASDGYLPGGIDTLTSEEMVAHSCNIELPRQDGRDYVGLLDECGGQGGQGDAPTESYHFHERLDCLYDGDAGGHSTKVAIGLEGTPLYGKWEDRETLEIPALDACGGHFGATPDSRGEVVYHNHVSDLPPFTFGCYGPGRDANQNPALVSLEECRALYPQCLDQEQLRVTTASGTLAYDPYCPCFSPEGNVGD